MRRCRIGIIFCCAMVLMSLAAGEAHAYLNPGTGSYIFQIIIAVMVGGLFAVKIFWRRIIEYFRNSISGKKKNG